MTLRHHRTGCAKPWQHRPSDHVQGNREEWRPIVGHEGLYEVSNHGRVRSLDRLEVVNDWSRVRRGRQMKILIDKDGYRLVRLCMAGTPRLWKVHRIVCGAWHGPCPAGHQCGHLNGIRDDNRPENLSWVTAKENASHKALHGTHQFGENAARVSLAAEGGEVDLAVGGVGERRSGALGCNERCCLEYSQRAYLATLDRYSPAAARSLEPPQTPECPQTE